MTEQVGSSSRGSGSGKNSSVHPQPPDSLLEAARADRRTGRAESTRGRVLDPEPYSKVVSTIVAGAMLLGAGGFAAIRILTHHKPPKVTLSPRGFEIAWE